jgi:probable HAF family extracellular repeat protein
LRYKYHIRDDELQFLHWTNGWRIRRAIAINDAGQVVGGSGTGSGGDHAFITGANGVGMTDLNTFLGFRSGVISGAISINNIGQVVAIATILEPSSYALLLVGLGAVSFMARRR